MKAIRNFQPFILCLVGLLLGGCSSSQASIDAKNEETKTYTYHRVADPTSSQLDTISSYDSLIATKNYIDSQALFLEDKHSVEESAVFLTMLSSQTLLKIRTFPPSIVLT